jgi:hypothetical protein
MQQQNQQPPTFQQVLDSCAASQPYIANFDNDCDTQLRGRNVALMLMHRNNLSEKDKLAIDMFIDYTIYFAYMKIIYAFAGKPAVYEPEQQ